MTCIHPQNDTYPVFTLTLSSMKTDYRMCFCHDLVKLSISKLEIDDHTNYPKTVDPRRKQD